MKWGEKTHTHTHAHNPKPYYIICLLSCELMLISNMGIIKIDKDENNE